MAKPGVMIYFGDAKVINKMSDAEAGALFRGILNYAENGATPPFAEDTDKLGLLWTIFKRSVDADSERYNNISIRRQYARYCGLQQSAGAKALPFDVWKEQTLTHVNTCQHTSTNVTNTISSTISNFNTIPITNSISSIGRKKEERKKLEKMLLDSISFLPADIEEFYYLLDQFGEESVRKAVSEAVSKGMKGETAWLYIQNRCVFI